MTQDRNGRGSDSGAGSKTRSVVKNDQQADSRIPVRLTNPDRVLYPDQGVTKRDLAEYYVDIAGLILPHIEGRPLSLVRCPSGRANSCFYQKHLTEGAPDAVKGVEIEAKGKRATYIMVDDLKGLVSLIQMGVLELHPWGSHSDDLEHPDIMVFDLDPGPGVEWRSTVEATRVVAERLDDLGLRSFLRTTGGKGLHVVVPLSRKTDWQGVKRFAGAIAKQFAKRDPDRYVAVMTRARREGKVFIDYLRNGRGATAVATYSTRARAGAPIATPLRWEELDSLKSSDAYRLDNIHQRISSLKGDPWEGFFEVRQSITTGMMKEVGL